MIYDSQIIREVQLEQLQSLKRLDEICRKYDIRYWVDYGTLIGTVRHHGFVPWDDDLDVGMMREDYERLCEVPVSEWGEDCLFLTAKSDDPRHDVIFGRVYRKNSIVQSFRDIEKWKFWNDNTAWNTMLMLDIFIFDYVPDDEKVRMQMFRKSTADRAYRQGYYFQYRDVKLKANIARKTIKSSITALIRREYGRIMRIRYQKPWLVIWERQEKMIAKSKKGSRIGTFTTTDSYAYEASDFFPLVTGKFEDMVVPMPKCWDQRLRDFYGDYMQYPPEEDRQHLDFAILEFGDSHCYNFKELKRL